MLTFKYLLPTALTAFTVLAPPALADRYVEVDAVQVGTCTQATPCGSIQLAVNSASAGETIHIGAGTFPEAVTAAKNLHFRGAGADRTVVASPERYPAFELSAGGSVRSLRATRGRGVQERATVLLKTTVSSVHRRYDVTDVEVVGGDNSTDGYGGPALAAVGENGAEMDLVVERARLGQVGDGFQRNPVVELTNIGAASLDDVTFTPDAHAGGSPGVDPGAALTATGDVTATITRSRTAGVWGGGVLAQRGAHATIERSRFHANDEALTVDASNVQDRAGSVTARDSAFLTFGTRNDQRAVDVRAADGHTAAVELVRSTVLTSAADPAAGLRAVAASGGAANLTLTDSVVDTFDTGAPANVPDVDPVEEGGTVTLTATRSLFAGADPRFVDPANLDVRPAPGSPLVDAGDPQLTSATDLAGAARPQDGDGDGVARSDIGAHERATLAPPQVDTVVGTELPAVQGTLPAVQNGLPAVQQGQLPAVQRSIRDRLAPAVKGLKLSGGKAKFTLGEAAKVTLTVERRRGRTWKRVARTTSNQRAGTRAITLAKLGNGTFRITVVAVDAAGNRTTKHITKGA